MGPCKVFLSFDLIKIIEGKKKKKRSLLTHSLPKTALAQGIFPALGSVAKFELALEVSLTNYWISWFCVRTQAEPSHRFFFTAWEKKLETLISVSASPADCCEGLITYSRGSLSGAILLSSGASLTNSL